MIDYSYREKNGEVYLVEQLSNKIITTSIMKGGKKIIIAVFKIKRWVIKYPEA